ncbi:MAG: hypothetical protein GXY36_09195 [Chloroflexi bacterium]|nr:hypothetical protein [Chloroflexota bacterium]
MDAKRSEITRIVEPELFEDEELLWAGRPRPARLAMKSLPTFLFGGFWLMIVLFIFGVQGFVFYSGGFSPRVFVGPGMCFGLIIPFFLLIGVGMLLAPLWGYYKGSRTVYALTDRRVIVIEPSWTTSVKSYGPQDIDFIERRTHGDGSGDIIFAYEERRRRSRGAGGHYRTRTYTVPIGLFGIPDAFEVEALMLDTFRPGEADYSSKPKRKREWLDE